MQYTSAEAVVVKAANTVTQVAAAGTVYAGLTLNEIGVIIGMAVAVVGLIGQLGITWYYKHQHLTLARRERLVERRSKPRAAGSDADYD